MFWVYTYAHPILPTPALRLPHFTTDRGAGCSSTSAVCRRPPHLSHRTSLSGSLRRLRNNEPRFLAQLHTPNWINLCGSTSLPVKWLLSSQFLVVHSDSVKEAHEGDEKHSTADTDADASSSGETVTVADHDFKTPVDDIQQEVTASLRNIGREAPELRCYQLKHELLTIQLNGKGTDLTEDAEENFEDLRCYSHNERVVLSTSEETWVECGLVLAEKAAINMIYPLHIMLSLNALQCADIDSTFQV